jgi:hypothetical protein
VEEIARLLTQLPEEEMDRILTIPPLEPIVLRLILRYYLQAHREWEVWDAFTDKLLDAIEKRWRDRNRKISDETKEIAKQVLEMRKQKIKWREIDKHFDREYGWGRGLIHRLSKKGELPASNSASD